MYTEIVTIVEVTQNVIGAVGKDIIVFIKCLLEIGWVLILLFFFFKENLDILKSDFLWTES